MRCIPLQWKAVLIIIVATATCFNLQLYGQVTFTNYLEHDGSETLRAVVQNDSLDYYAFGNSNSFQVNQHDQDLLLIKFNPQGETLWAKTYDSGLNDVGHGMAVDALGNLILVGFREDTTLAQIEYEAFVMKVNADGDLQWFQTYDQGYNEQFNAVDILSDNSIIVTGGVAGEVVMRLLPSGTMLWAKQLTLVQSNSTPEGKALHIYENDDILVLGKPQTSDSDYTITRLNANGNVLWAKRYTAANFADPIFGNGIAVDNQGRIAVVGRATVHVFPITIDAILFSMLENDGSPIWNKNHYMQDQAEAVGYDIETTLDNGFLVAAILDGNPGRSGHLIFKTNSEGNVLWNKLYDLTHAKNHGSFETRMDMELSNDGLVYTSLQYLAVSGTQNTHVHDSYINKLDTGDLSLIDVICFPSAEMQIEQNFELSSEVISWTTANNLTAISRNLTTTSVEPYFYQGCLSCPLPEADFVFTDSVQGEYGVQFVNITSYADEYEWNFGDGVVSYLQHPLHYYNQNGVYDVTLVVTNACGTDTVTKQLNIINAGLWFHEQDLGLSLFPNPTSATVRFLDPQQHFAKNSHIRVVNLLGKEVLQQLYTSPLDAQSLDVSNLSTGVYQLSATTEVGTAFFNLVITD